LQIYEVWISVYQRRIEKYGKDRSIQSHGKVVLSLACQPLTNRQNGSVDSEEIVKQDDAIRSDYLRAEVEVGHHGSASMFAVDESQMRRRIDQLPRHILCVMIEAYDLSDPVTAYPRKPIKHSLF
jgi:hypothetical protein